MWGQFGLPIHRNLQVEVLIFSLVSWRSAAASERRGEPEEKNQTLFAQCSQITSVNTEFQVLQVLNTVNIHKKIKHCSRLVQYVFIDIMMQKEKRHLCAVQRCYSNRSKNVTFSCCYQINHHLKRNKKKQVIGNIVTLGKITTKQDFLYIKNVCFFF